MPGKHVLIPVDINSKTQDMSYLTPEQGNKQQQIPYVGQAYDQAEFELVRGGWKRNLCEICRWELCESDDEQHATGYTDGLRWICTECYDFLVRRR